MFLVALERLSMNSISNKLTHGLSGEISEVRADFGACPRGHQ